MKLASLLQPELIVVRGRAETLEQAQDQLLARLAKEKDLETGPLKQALQEREALGTTVVAPGIAFPHARVDLVDDFHLVLGTFPDGVAAPQTPDPVRLVLLFLLPEGQSNLYLRCVSSFARFLGQEGALDRLVAADSAQDVREVVEEAGVLVKDVVTAIDMIKPGTEPRAAPCTTLREAADLMVLHRTTHIPVVDDAGQYLGMVDADRLLKVGLPDYLLSMDNLSFLSTFEPFGDLLKQERSTCVDAILIEDYPLFMAHTPMIVVAAKLVREGLFSAPVLDKDKKLVGMISTLDFVHKVVRA